jgi:hypothetical protein
MVALGLNLNRICDNIGYVTAIVIVAVMGSVALAGTAYDLLSLRF